MYGTTIYRKPTNTDRLLDQCSYHPTCHKATAVRTLARRAHLVCDSHNSQSSETKHVHDVFHKNNYNQDFISRNYYRDNGPNSTNTRPTTVNGDMVNGLNPGVSVVCVATKATLLNTIYKRTTESTGTVMTVFHSVQTTTNDCQQLPAPYKRLINDKQNKPDKQTNQTNNQFSQPITTPLNEPTSNNITRLNQRFDLKQPIT